MKKNLLYSIFFFLPIAGYGQQGQDLSPFKTHQIIKISSPASLDVSTSAARAVEFNEIMDLNSGKIILGFYKLTITDDVPWVVTVMAAQPFFSSSSSDASGDMPAGIIHLKESSRAEFIPLSATPLSLLVGDGAEVPEIFYVDVKVDPSWNYRGGDYSQEIIFTLSAQ